MATSFVEQFRDDFDDGTVGLETDDLGNGAVAETGGKLRITCPVGVNCDWWSGVSTAPRPYKNVSDVITEPTLFKAETRLSSLSSSIATNATGLAIWFDAQNAWIISYAGTPSGTGNIDVSEILSGSASSVASTGATITDPNADPIEFRIYWSIAQKAYMAPDLGFTADQLKVYLYFKRDSVGTWTLLHTADWKWRVKKVGMYNKRWGSTPETMAEYDYLAIEEHIDDSLVIATNSYDPTTMFDDSSLPKVWANRLSSTPDYGGNTVTPLSPGLRISSPTKYGVPNTSADWSGIVGAGWGFVSDTEPFSLEIAWENMVLNDYGTAQATNSPHFGVAVEWMNRNKETGGQSLTNVFCGRRLSGQSPHPTYGYDKYLVASGDNRPGGLWNGIHGTVDRPIANGTGEDRVKLVRNTLSDWSGYWWDGDSWQPIALGFSPGVGQTGNVASMQFKWGIVSLCGFADPTFPTVYPTVDLKEFKLNYGTVAPLYTAPAEDDFSDGSRDVTRYNTYTYNNLYYPNDNANEIVGAVEWDFLNFWYDDLGMRWAHCFYPGTDIDCTFDLEIEVINNLNYIAIGAVIWFNNNFSSHAPIPTQAGTRDEIHLELLERSPSYYLGPGLVQTGYVYNRSGTKTSLGGRTDVHGLTCPYVHPITVRVTRIDNVWSFYVTSNAGGPNLVSTWTDTNRVLTDSPVQFGAEVTSQSYQLEPKFRVVEFSIASGDTELPPPTAPTVTQIENYLVKVEFGVPLDTDIDEFNDPSSYLIESIGGGVEIEVTSAELVDENTVHLGVTLASDGEDYRFTILSAALFTEAGDPLFGETDDYVASVVGPRLMSVVPVSSTKVRATFERDLQTTFDAKNVSKYVFSGGISAVAVKRITPTIVDITTTEQDDNTIYGLTVNP